MIPYLIYIVDDEPIARDGIQLALANHYQVQGFATAEDAIDAIDAVPPDLLLLDIGLPGMSGIDALREIKKQYPEILIIMITAYEDVQTVVSAMKYGAYDYVVKPLQMGALLVNIRNAVESIAMRKEIQTLHEKYLKENLPCFIGESNVIQDVMDTVKKVAKSPDTSILIIGETGTGKELIARAVHYRSPNFQGPFVCVNCAAIPKELIESELFGYEKGAFSGAEKSGKKGLVEKAEEGTLFLDEVGDLSLDAQAKLLRFLETGEFYRVGGIKKHHVETRVVSATNKDLQKMMEQDLFRTDLYYRFAVVTLEIPSLKYRRDDIIPIAKHYLIEYSEKFGKSFTGISLEAEAALKNYKWRGNVRELKNLIERGVLLGEGPLLNLSDIGFANPGDASDRSEKEGMQFPEISEEGIDLPEVIGSIEKHYFQKALSAAKDNESKAAKLLGLSRDTFRYRRKKWNV